jgi:hypothetical protein
LADNKSTKSVTKSQKLVKKNSVVSKKSTNKKTESRYDENDGESEALKVQEEIYATG